MEKNTPINVEDNTEVVIVKRKRSGQSPVWNFAERVSSDKVRCYVCKLSFKCPLSNTSNIRDHLLNKHRGTKEAEEFVAKINEKSQAKKLKENKKDKLKEKPCSIKQFFNSDQLPICENKSFESVESHFFRKLMFTANNSYIMPYQEFGQKGGKVGKPFLKIISEQAACEINPGEIRVTQALSNCGHC